MASSSNSYDNFLGRILASTAASTDAYAEVEILLPQIVAATQAKGSPLWVPVLRQVDMQLIGSVSALAADSAIRAGLMLGGASLFSAVPATGIADPNCIVDWSQSFAVTTSGVAMVQHTLSVELPGDGIIVTASALTGFYTASGTGTGIAVSYRIWYDFVSMDEMTYMRALHGMAL